MRWVMYYNQIPLWLKSHFIWGAVIFVIAAIIYLLAGCSDTERSVYIEDPPDEGETKHFILRPSTLERDRYPCSPEGANQVCYERGYENAVDHDGCQRVGDEFYLTGVTCWRP